MGHKPLQIIIFLTLTFPISPAWLCVAASTPDSSLVPVLVSPPYSIPAQKQVTDSFPNSPDKDKFVQEYKDLLINTLKRSPDPVSQDKVQPVVPKNNFEEYENLIVRNIRFLQLEVFGQNVNDTTVQPDSWAERLGNGLHINTLEYVLKNRLLFNAGDPLDLYTLSENERMYRLLPFIGDARVLVTPAGTDSVDITFVIKDVIPVSGSLEIFDVVYGRASISNKSILGLGHEVYYNNKWNGNRAPYYGHSIRYRVPNISNTFFALDGSYENTWNKEAVHVSLARPFYSARTKYAGGIAFDQVNAYMNIDFPKDTHDSIEVDYNFYDMWIGRALNLKLFSSNERQTHITLTTRFYRYEFFKQPGEVALGFLHAYHERDMYLAGLSISSHGYQKSSLIYGFGRTEDVPFGLALSGVMGFERSQFQDRWYFGGTFAHATKLTPYGYWYHQVQFGTYLGNSPEQGHFTFKMNYFSPLLNSGGLYSYRMFATTQYQSGYHRNKDEFLKFTSRDGIRGLSSSTFRGNQRLNLNLDFNCYSPHYVLGFRMVYFTFFDVGIISNDYSRLFRNQTYSGFGIGIKARNENLIFDTFILQLGYYPVVPEGASPEYFRLTATGYQRFNRFVVERPEVWDYQERY